MAPRPLHIYFALIGLVIVVNICGANNNSSRWEPEIKAFEAQDRTNPPPNGAVLFIGSSSIRLWTNLAEAFPSMATLRRGFGGSYLPDQTAFAERIIFPYRPSKIVVYAGENDIARGDSPQDVSKAFRAFVGKMHDKFPKTPIFYISIKPAPSRWHLSPQEREANRLIRSYCRRHKLLQFIDIWPLLLDQNGRPSSSLFVADQLHLNEKGYALWAKEIRQALHLSRTL